MIVPLHRVVLCPRAVRSVLCTTSIAYLDSDHPAVADLPQVVNEEYHSLYPLVEQAVSKTLGLSTCHFKAMSMKDATVV